jgi:prepilin-type N-terminal cleavage/methylation domain-containing protein
MNARDAYPAAGCRGFSILEVIVVMALAGVLLGIAAFNFRALRDPAQDASQQVMGFFKQTRARALASTRAYTISPASATQLVTTYGDTCTSTTQTNDPQNTLTLPDGAEMETLGWTFCYSTRGLSSSSVNITVSDENSSHVVQAVLGGGVRVQ